LDKFYSHKGRKDGLMNECKTCRNISHQKWVIKNRKHLNTKNKLWRKTNREKIKAQKRKAKFGISEIEFNTMLSNQNFSCAICGLHKDKFYRNFNVDHCHKTGKIRGLLCNTCNQGLGLLKDDKDLLTKAISYLEVGNEET